MTGIFINYRGEDSQTAAALIDRELTACFGNDLVFLDSRSIPAGTDFVDELLGRVRTCSVLLVVIGPHWLTLTNETGQRRIDDPQDWIRREIVEAFSHGLRVIPVLVDSVKPAEAELPDDIAGLSRRQYVPLRRRYTAVDLAFLVERITEEEPELAKTAAQRQANDKQLQRQLPAAVSHFAGRVSELAALTDLSDVAAVEKFLSPARVRNTLPADTSAFTGRSKEIQEITTQLLDTTTAGRATAIRVIDGMPGVGKTALAIHVAHMLADRFPSRQLFVDLNAHRRGRLPTDPADVLASLLTFDGVDPHYVPDSIDGRAAMWRDRMAGHQALLVLDNAASVDQVAPLLPGSPGCLVLITSRRRLTGLQRLHGAIILTLGTLAEPEAVTLLARVAGRVLTTADQAAAARLVQLCGYLPMAITILAAALDPPTTVVDLLADLEAAQDRLSGVDGHLDDDEFGVAAAFELSYQHLSTQCKSVLRLLGLVPGVDVDIYSAAALTGLPIPAALRHLHGLYTHRLLEQPRRGRYRMHDLVRDYARILAIRYDTVTEHGRAVDRLLDYYQCAAARADAYLARHTSPASGLAAIPLPEAVPDLPDRDRAQAWMAVERPNILACIDHAAAHRYHTRVAGLTATLAAHLRQDGPWATALALHVAAATSARHLCDRVGEANSLTELGVVRWLTDDYPSAADVLEHALGIYRDVGNRVGEANALSYLGAVRRLTGDYPGAVDILEQALAIYRDLGDRLGEANALSYMGAVWQLTGDYPIAIGVLDQALVIYRDLGNRLGEASTLNELGIIRQLTGDYPTAIGVLDQALVIYRDLGNRLGEANALSYVGAAWQLTGDYPTAIDVLEQARVIHHDIGNRLGEAEALTYLGGVWYLTGDYPGAADVLERALGIYCGLGNRLGEANALNYLGAVRQLTGDYPGAADVLERALGIYRDLGNRLGEANALNHVGLVRYRTGDFPGAAVVLEEAVVIYRDLGDQVGEAEVLNYLGVVRQLTGDYSGAADVLEKAVVIYRDLGDRLGEAEALNNTGALRLACGDPQQAHTDYQLALELARAVCSQLQEARALEGSGRSAQSMSGDTNAGKGDLQGHWRSTSASALQLPHDPLGKNSTEFAMGDL